MSTRQLSVARVLGTVDPKGDKLRIVSAQYWIEVLAIIAMLVEIGKTKRGHDLVEAILNGPDDYVILVEDGINSKGMKVGKGGTIILKRGDTDVMFIGSNGLEHFTLLRVIAHEIGHAVDGLKDDGPDDMANVNATENPIMTELGGHERKKYSPVFLPLPIFLPYIGPVNIPVPIG